MFLSKIFGAIGIYNHADLKKKNHNHILIEILRDQLNLYQCKLKMMDPQKNERNPNWKLYWTLSNKTIKLNLTESINITCLQAC